MGHDPWEVLVLEGKFDDQSSLPENSTPSAPRIPATSHWRTASGANIEPALLRGHSVIELVSAQRHIGSP
jgi:hypothetical protein